MTTNAAPLSRAIPRWTLLVLAGSILVNIATDLVVAAFNYRAMDALDRGGGANVAESLGTLSNHLWHAGRMAWFPVMLAVVAYALARRGRRWLFAGPAVAFFIAPLLVAFYWGTPGTMLPGLGDTFGWLAGQNGDWVTWVASTVRLVLVLLPGIVVAQYAPRAHNTFSAPAIAMLAVPALLVGYFGILKFSESGHLEISQAAGYIAAFAFGAAMGFDRPLWPWALVAVPAVFEGLPAPVMIGEGGDLVVIALIALLSAVSVPFGRILHRGWQENTAPGMLDESRSPAG